MRIIDGAAGVEANVRLFRALRRRPTGPIWFFGTEYDEPEFREALAADGRLVYEFEVLRSSGVLGRLASAPTLAERSGPTAVAD